MPSIEMLPEEPLVEILKHLSHADRLTCATISHRFAEALTHPQFMKDIWFTVRGNAMRRAAPVVTRSCREYQNLRLVEVDLYQLFGSEFWGRIGGTLRRLVLDGCSYGPEVLYDIFRKCASLEYVSICDCVREILPVNRGTCGTSVEDVRASLSNAKHLHLRTFSVDVLGHLLELIPNVSSVSLQVLRGEFPWKTLIHRILADPQIVTELDLGLNSTSDADLILIMGAFSKTLRELRLDCTGLTPRAAEAIADCSRLRSLLLQGFRGLQSAQMARIIRNNPGLEKLDLINCNSLTDDGLLPILELRKLCRLNLHGCQAIKNEFSCRVGEILTLECLDLSSNQLDLSTIQSITRLKNLEELYLNSYVQSSESLRMICMNLGKLRTLNLGDCQDLSDADGLMLSRLRRLRTLCFRNAPEFKDLGFEVGVWGTEMEFLTVEGSSLTDLGLLSLVGQQGCLKQIKLYGCTSITDQGLMTLLSRAPVLEKLDLVRCPSIGNEFIEAFGHCCPRLRSVEILYCATSFRAVKSFREQGRTVNVCFAPRELDPNP